MDSMDEDVVRSGARSGQAMTRIKSVNPSGWDCKLAEAVEDANKLVNALLLVLPLLLELLVLLQLSVEPVVTRASSKIWAGMGFSGNSVIIETTKEKEID